MQSDAASPAILDVAVVPLHNPGRVVGSASERQIQATGDDMKFLHNYGNCGLFLMMGIVDDLNPALP